MQAAATPRRSTLGNTCDLIFGQTSRDITALADMQSLPISTFSRRSSCLSWVGIGSRATPLAGSSTEFGPPPELATCRRDIQPEIQRYGRSQDDRPMRSKIDAPGLSGVACRRRLCLLPQP